MITWIQIIWLIVPMLLFVPASRFVYYAWRLYFSESMRKETDAIKRESIIRLVAAFIFLGTQLSFFAVGLYSIARPQSEASAGVVVTAVITQSLGLYLLSKQSMPVRYSIKSRLIWFFGAVGVAIMIGGLIWAFAFSTPAPFRYTGGAVVTKVYCPGDPLEVVFTGFSAGVAQKVIVTGDIFDADTPTRRVHSFPPFETNSPARTENIGVELEVVLDTAVFGWFIPDALPPGNYIYKHSNEGVNTASSTIEMAFTVSECDG